MIIGNASNSSKGRGFTLIELLVVMAIAGTSAAIVGPNLWRSYQKYSEQQALSNYAFHLNEMRREFLRKNHSLTISKDQLVNEYLNELPKLPEGWLVEGNSALFFLPTGVTSGGGIKLESSFGNIWRMEISALSGKITYSIQNETVQD